jgi:hypothetical protein
LASTRRAALSFRFSASARSRWRFSCVGRDLFTFTLLVARVLAARAPPTRRRQ